MEYSGWICLWKEEEEEEEKEDKEMEEEEDGRGRGGVGGDVDGAPVQRLWLVLGLE